MASSTTVKSENQSNNKVKQEPHGSLNSDNNEDKQSQTTFLMNIQTTADLISYVKKRQQKQHHKKRKRYSRRFKNSPPNVIYKRPINKRDNYRHINNMRMYGIMGQASKEVEIQTEDIDILDLRVSEINLSEIYHFDRVSSSLK
jgi:hypothetical protein